MNADPLTPSDLDLDAPARFHVVGIGGSGMSAIATVLMEMGHIVSGSDAVASAAFERLRAAGAAVVVGHGEGNLAMTGAPGELRAVVVSTAIDRSNPDVAAALEAGVEVLSRADMLAAICARAETIAIGGTHGKTTTTAMVASILSRCGVDPSYIVGGDVADLGTNARWSGGRFLVVEADESDGTFLRLPRQVSVLTNAEPDHLEYYGGFDALSAAFDTFVDRTDGPSWVCADQPDALAVARRTSARTYGLAPEADLRIVDQRQHGTVMSASLLIDGLAIGDLRLPMPGIHNLTNAAAAVAVAMECGVATSAALEALGQFGGVGRRFERRGSAGGADLVDDYAHLPSEVKAAISAAKAGGWSRVVTVFQPHRYSRTEQLGTTFFDAFDEADVLVLAGVYGAGEVPRPGVSGRTVADAVASHWLAAGRDPADLVYVDDRSALAGLVAPLLRPGDVCLTLGAGDVTRLSDELRAILEPDEGREL